MANDTTAAASVQPMTAESAADAIEAMMSVDDGEQQDQEAQQDDEQDSESEQEDDESEVEDAADDEESDEESEEDVDEDQEDEPQRFTVKVDGKEVEVTIDELKQGYSRTEDYTRKTQALAQERKAAQAELEQVRTERQQYAQLLGALQQQLTQAEAPQDMDALYESDPIEWMRQRELMRDRQERQQAIQAEQQRLMREQQVEQQRQMQEFLEGQKNALIQAVPELRDPQFATAEKNRWVEAGKSIGFTDQELAGITDHRVLLALKAIADYNGIKAKRQQIKPVQPSKKVVKPGSTSNVSQKSSSVKKSQQRLRSSGNVRDAASLIEQFL